MDLKITLFFLICCSCTVYSNGKATIPSFIHLCKQSDPEMNKCILNTVTELKPNLAKGIPEIRLVPLSPFKMEKLSLKSGNNLELELTDVELGNLMSFEIEHFNMDLGTVGVELNMKFPLVEVKGKYKLKGHLLLLDLNGSGHCVINLKDVVLKTKLYGKRTQKAGKEYLDFNKCDVDIQISDADVNFENLFAGNKQLTDQTNGVLNENPQAILTEFQPMISSSFRSVILTVVSNVFNSFPVDELLPK
ncbi:protein takeout-like [Onthophagus taurus]|uniref:protein takeout-like n=1 Tax=Onthophagus taurus TaxID=166361 RepID=UPI0039BE52EF